MVGEEEMARVLEGVEEDLGVRVKGIGGEEAENGR